MYRKQSRKVPTTAPLEFVPESWRKVVMTPTGIDRQYYKFCALSELEGALRSGDNWVKGSRRYKNFDDYLIPEKDFDKLTPVLPMPASADYHEYITGRMILLQSRLEDVNTMAALTPRTTNRYGQTSTYATSRPAPTKFMSTPTSPIKC